ncbi:MAG: hypothetical protein LBI80_01890 [Endomicrobium sp.]|jgi:hypothetical protein|nr:hypothetical protein [Endomicrobium sp.]
MRLSQKTMGGLFPKGANMACGCGCKTKKATAKKNVVKKVATKKTTKKKTTAKKKAK